MGLENPTHAGGEPRRPWTRGALLACGFAALLAACGRDDAAPAANRLLPEGVEMAQTEMRTVVTREGVRRATVEGDTAEWRGEHEVHLRPMRILFYDVNGNPSSDVTSAYGIYDELTGDLEAEGDVVAEDRVDGQRLETERMRYVNAEGRLYGPVSFRLSRAVGSMLVEGSAFESDPGLDSIIVLNPEGETRPRLITTTDPEPAEDVDAGAEAVDTGVSEEGGAAADAAVAQEPPAAGDAEGGAAAADSAAVDETPDAGAPRESPVAEDSAAVPADSAVAPPDTATAADPLEAGRPEIDPATTDSLVVPPDTTAADPLDAGRPEVDPVAADSTVAPPDSTVVPPDSTVAPPDTAAAPPDTTARR